MVSFMSTCNRFISSSYPVQHCPSFTSLSFLNHPRRLPLCVSFGFFPAKRCSSLMSMTSFGTPVLLYGNNSRSCLIRRCMSFENEGYSDIEAEVLAFMEKSSNPEVFPTKNELINAGRMDLVEAIEKRGGWLSYGWDSEEDEETVQDDEFEGPILVTDKEVDNGSVLGDTRSWQQNLDGGGERSLVEGVQVGSSETELSHASPYLGSASDESLQREAAVGSGIEGILSGLEKERNLKFGIDLRTKEGGSLDMRNEVEDDYQSKVPAKAVTGLEKSNGSAYLRASEELLAVPQDMHIHSRYSSDGDGFGRSFKPAMWRKWSTHRAGFSNSNFEAADIVPTNDNVYTKAKDENDTSYKSKESVSSYKKNEPNDIRTHLQNLDEELSSVLNLLRTRTDELILHKGHGSSLEELRRLSDDWEFQETAIIKAKDKLRSSRAKLAVLEGKMTLALSEAQKAVEEKQRRIDGAQRALDLLRTVCINWSSPASEVLLCGSFDGWSSQRKMERSSGGIFSAYLQLYPGRYEIKYIVDGVWKVDPLIPIVHNNGFENNLLIVV